MSMDRVCERTAIDSCFYSRRIVAFAATGDLAQVAFLRHGYLEGQLAIDISKLSLRFEARGLNKSSLSLGWVISGGILLSQKST